MDKPLLLLFRGRRQFHKYKILTKSSGSSYEIYACGAISATTGTITDHRAVTGVHNSDNPLPIDFTLSNKDVWLIKTDPAFSTVNSDQYNKTNMKVNTGAYPYTPTSIDPTDYTNTALYPYQEVGPLSARNMDGSGYLKWSDYYYYDFVWYGTPGTYIESPATLYLAAPNNYNETAFDMVFTNDGSDHIALIAGVNFVGSNIDNIWNDVSNLVRSESTASVAPDYREYMDCDGFLLDIVPGDIGVTTTTTRAKNVGHFSGSNFNLQVRQDLEHHYIITGSTADLYGSSDYNLPDPSPTTQDQNGLIIAATTDFTSGSGRLDLWRRCFIANDARAESDTGPDGDDNNEDCLCIYGLDLTADGGYVIGGNNGNNEADWSVTKFAPLHEQLMIASNSYEKFGGSAIPTEHTVSGTETWTTNKNIASKVTIPDGATLTISGGTYSFAASDQLWDYFQAPSPTEGCTLACGIFVQPGGTLNVTNATLQGVSITGEKNVWDGIVVEGTPTSTSAAVQGKVNLNGATIKDARYGLYVADNYRTYYHPSGVTYGLELGHTYASRYDGTINHGGGIVTAGSYGGTPTTFLNCYYGANFEKYGFPNTSSFTGCTFNSDATGMGDICFYTDVTGGLIPSGTHIGAWYWGGLNLYNNTFTCNTAYAVNVRPIGVQGANSTLGITNGGSGAGNAFSNLKYGIVASNNNFININYNTFTNNANAINAASGNSSIAIQNNQVNIPTLPGYAATGLTLAGNYGYAVSKNTFDRVPGTGPYGDMGIVVNDGHIGSEMIKNNTFNHVSMCITALQTNGDPSGTSGLQFHCNNFAGTYSAFDIQRNSSVAVYPYTPIAATISSIQGDCGTGTSPTGNQFSTYCPLSGAPVHLEDDSWVTQAVTYNANTNATGSPFDPYPCFNSALITDNHCNTLPIDATDACPSPGDFTPPYGCPYCVSPTDMSGILTTLDADILGTSDHLQLSVLHIKHDQAVNELALYYASIADYSDAAALFAGYGMYRAALPYYIAAGDYQDAQSMHQNLPLVTADDTLYAWESALMIDLYANGHTWFDLDTASADSMTHLVQTNSSAGYLAGSITTLLGLAPVAWPVPRIDSAAVDTTIAHADTSARHSYDHGTTPLTKGSNDNTEKITVYPNPTNGALTVKTANSGRVIIYTMLGQQVVDYFINSGETELLLPVNLAPGIYLGKFMANDRSNLDEFHLVYQP